MSSHADHILSLYLCGYRKGLSTQQARLSLLEKKENIMNKNIMRRSCATFQKHLVS